MKYQVCKSCDVDKNTGVVSDEYIRLTGQNAKYDYPDLMRLVVYEDFSTGNVYRFLTNDFFFMRQLRLQSCTVNAGR